MASEVTAMPPLQIEEKGRRMEEGESSPDDGASSPCSEGSPSKSSHKSTDPKICGVCGDKALGNNFNAITCESCKAFFRRNALRTKEFVCPFSNNCKVDAITRRFCQRCRLKKCFDIGMKKEWIMTDEEKRIKKQKIEQNRLKRTSFENAGSNSMTGEDGDISGSPPAVKVHVTEQLQAQRGTANGGVGVDGADGEGASKADSPKIMQKQPMMPHNQNNTSHSTYQTHGPLGISTRITSDNDSDGGKSFLCKERTNVIAITVNATPAGERCSYSSGDEGDGEHPLQAYILPNQVPVVMQYEERNTSSSWIEPGGSDGDSSSNSSSHPPPLVKHGIKGHYLKDKLYMAEEDVGVEDHQQEGLHTNSTNQNMPLLSSLIRPGHSESPTDDISTPTETPDCDDTSSRTTTIVSKPSTLSTVHGRAQEKEMDKIDHLPNILPHSPQHHQPPPRSVEKYEQQSPIDYYSNNLHHHHQISPNYRPTTQEEDMERHVVSSANDAYSYYHHHHHSSPQFEVESRHGEYSSAHNNNKTQSAVEFRMSRTQSSQRHHNFGNNDDDEHEVIPPLPLNTMDSILSVAIAAEFNAFSMLGGNTNSKELNKAEQAKLSELLLASQALLAPVDAERPIKVNETSDPSLINVINLTEIAIRRLIKMSKKISGFKNMCQEDQIALLKGGCTEMMILRSVTTYDPDRDSWQIPHSNQGYNINLGVLKEARGNLYEEHQRFVKSFRSLWRRDENIMSILCAISLFTPERPNVVHKDVVKLEQDSYYYLLKRYLESILNGCEAKSSYLQLIRKIAELRALNSNHVRVFLEVNPKEVEPLLIEIFDLK